MQAVAKISKCQKGIGNQTSDGNYSSFRKTTEYDLISFLIEANNLSMIKSQFRSSMAGSNMRVSSPKNLEVFKKSNLTENGVRKT